MRTGVLLLAISLLGCATFRGPGPAKSTVRGDEERPADARGSGGGPRASEEEAVAQAVCGADRLRTVRARFRATVAAGNERAVTDGVLLVKRPGAVRVKLFGIAGLTVHDATWRGDASRVRGRLSGLDRDEPLSLEQSPREPVAEPAARLSLVLWSLWQPRCERPPRPVAGAPSTFALDPAPAQVRSREVQLRGDEVRSDTLGWADGEAIVARYANYDRRLAVPLPEWIEIDLPSAGWTAEVRVSEYDLDESLDDALFALPEDERDP